MHATSTTAPRTVPARTSSSSSADMLVSPLKITFVTLWLVTIVGGLAVDVTIDVVQDRYASFPLTLALAFSVSLTLLALLMTALLGRWVQRGFALYQPFVGGDVFVCLQACGYALVTVATALKVVLASEAQHRRHYYYGAFAVLGVFVTAAQVVLMLSLQYFRPPRRHRRARRSKVCEQQQQQQQQQHDSSSSSSDDDDDDSAHTTRLSRVLRNMTPSPRREVLLLTLLMPIEVASAVAAEHYHSYGRVAVVLTWLFVCASMTILHTCVARPFLPRSYHVVLRPFALPSWRLSAMQLCANALLLTCLSGNVVLYTLHPLTPPSWHLACALAAVTAMCTHLLLLRRLGLTLAPHASTRAADAAAMLMPDVTTTTTATAALQTPLLASLVSVVCSALVYGSVLTTSLRRTSSTSSQTTTTTTTTMSPLQPQQHSSEQHYEAAVVQVQWVLSALLFALPPFTHLQGRVAFGARYAMYQPFGGDVDFVLLHAAAWTAYAIGIFLATLHASAHTRSEFLLLYVTCLLLAQLFVHAALHVFHRQQQQQQQTTSHHADTTAATPPHDVSASTDATNTANNNDKNNDDDDGHVVRAHARDKSTHTTQLLTMVMNGNMLLAIVLGTVSVLLRAVCDGMMLRSGSTSDSTSGNGGVSQPVRALARAATVLSLLATPIAQLSMQHQHHHSNSDDDDADNDDDAVATPSRQRGRAGASARHVVAVAVGGGGGGCAALQAISWLLYSFVVLAAVLSECASAHGTDDARTRRHHAHNNNNNNKYNSGDSRAGMTTGRVRWAAGYVPMQYTYVGLLCGVPQLCVLLCSFLYAQARVQYTRRAARVRHATVQLRTTMQRHGVVGDDWRRCEQLLRLLAGDDDDDNDDDNHADDTHNDRTTTAAVAAAASDAPPALPRGHRRRLVTRASSPSAVAAREAAQCLVGVMCLVCLVSFLGAVYVADVPPATTLAFVLAGLASLSLSCFSLHGVYGARMHGHSKSSGSNNNDDNDDDDDNGRGGAYTLFMPFVGGTRFVLEQATGWASYTACVCLGIACLVDGHAAPRVCVTLSLLSVVSQVALLHSIDCFDTAAAADVRHSIIGRNADALLAVCTLLGTFAFARAYDARRGGVVARAARTAATTTVTTTVTSTHDERDALSLVPVVLVGIALTLSVPLGLVSLQRQAERYGMPLRTLLHGRSERASDGRRRRRRHSGGDDDDDDAANLQQRQPSLHRVTASQRHGDDDDDRGDANDAATAATMTPPLPHVRRQSTTTTMSSSSSLSSSFAAAAASSSHDSTATATTTTATMLERDGSYYNDDDDDDDDDGSSSVRDGVDDASSTATAASSRRRRWQQQQQQRRRRRRGALGVTYTLAVLVGALLAVLMPFAVLLLAYACVRAAAPVYAVAVRAISLLVGAFALVLLLPLIAAPALHHSRVLRNVHSALCCWLLYSIPTIVVLSALTPLLVHTRGAWLTASNMVLVSVFSVIPCVHVLGYVLSVACLGHMLQHHVYVCAYAHRERLAWRAALSDVVVALLWVCYMQRYHGQPHLTGRYYSDRAVRFFQRYLFRGMAHYFSLRVVVCDGVVGSGDNNDEEGDALQTRVCLNNNNNDNNNNDNSDTSSPQYVFSMHPHGIFPMSAAYVPHTVQWERKVGCGRRRDNNKSNNKNNNDKNNKNKNNNNNNNKNNTMTTRTHFVSTHAADVMFSVPLLRDVVMCLGGMSVSRRAIEHSLCSGNSPLIVTGGQSEMLLMRRSATEMHLLCSHVGFIRVALQHRVPLVPIIAFAENNVLDMVHWPRLQRWCLRRVAFPLPVLPYGRWWLPLPTTQPMTIVVGRALWPRHGRDNADDVACVREMQYRYFAHLEWLFYTYRRTAGYPHMKLYLHNGVDDVGHTATPRPRDDNNDNDDDTRAAEAAVGSVSDHDGDDDEERQMWLHYRSAVPDALRFRLDDDDNDNSEERAVPALDKKAQ